MNAEQSRFEKIVPVPPPKHEIVRDNATGLEWQAMCFDKRMTWKEATKACEELHLGGHDDWRLPTRAELLALVDDTRCNPTIDTDAFPGTPSEWFWTSTAYADDPDTYAWIVDFSNGYSSVGYRDGDGRVRAVRGPARQ